ncbi:sensor domain-containing diguanylate cyclase, partial [Lichenifustis flavocetrariae]
DCFADRDYFKVHTTGNDVGLFVSKPFLSRISGTWTIALTRRINNPDGSFGGVALASLKLSYLDKLYATLNQGAEDAITLFRTDGTVVTRKPFVSDVVNKSFRASDSFTRIRTPPVGSFEGPSPVSGQERLISFHRVGALPLIQVIEISAKGAYADWWRKTVIVGSVLGLLCLSSVSLLVLLNIELARRVKVEAVLARLAMTDGLTEVANRRRFDEVLETEWQRAMRDRTSIALLMIDADHFKAYNDTFGHQKGDELLRNLAACVASHVHRPADLVARYGGEEFVVLLPRTDLTGALAVAEMMRTAIVALAAPHPKAARKVATVSIGVTCMQPNRMSRSDELVTRADAALYQAKLDGRDCCRSAPDFERGAKV